MSCRIPRKKSRNHNRKRLQLLEQALRLEQKDDLVHRRPDVGFRDVDRQVGLGGLLVGVVHTGEALDLPVACLGVDAALVRLLGVLERGSHVDEVEAAVLLDELAGVFAGVLEGRNGRGDDGGAGLGELRGNEGDAADVAVAIFAGVAEFGRELGADVLAQEQGDGASTLLVESDVQRARDRILARVCETGEENGETLLVARGVRFAEDLDDFRVREPLGDLLAGTEALSEL